MPAGDGFSTLRRPKGGSRAILNAPPLPCHPPPGVSNNHHFII